MTTRPQPKEIASQAYAAGSVPTFLTALCELLMCSDPYPCSVENQRVMNDHADYMARKLGFLDWVEAYPGLCWSDEPKDDHGDYADRP